jgi:predicted DsbA family dithiol-disulfide isomerase
VGIEIAIHSDVCCPWCWIGRRRLAVALAALAPGLVTISWHPFRLNPDLPPAGMPRDVYRRRKFGSDAYAQALDERVTAVARELGLAFALHAQRRTPNTLLAHRLIWLAGRQGVQEAMVESLFRAYFCDGQDIGDPAILARLAGEQGLDQRLVAGFLAGEEGRLEVAAEEAAIRSSGLDSVPLFIINGGVRIGGAQPPAVFSAAISAAAAAAGGESRHGLG